MQSTGSGHCSLPHLKLQRTQWYSRCQKSHPGSCQSIWVAETSLNMKVGLGTDISGGHTPSIWEVMRQTLIASNCLQFGTPAYKPLSYKEVFALATIGGAQVWELRSLLWHSRFLICKTLLGISFQERNLMLLLLIQMLEWSTSSLRIHLWTSFRSVSI